jgi:hypothetical protein
MHREIDHRSDAVALRGRLGQAYGEKAFRYFLTLERKRSRRSSRTFLVLLIHLKPPAGVPANRTVVSKIFSCLWQCLRESDFVGWYREDRVAGAVLTQQPTAAPDTDVSRAVAKRVNDALADCIPKHLVDGVRVRVYRVQPTRSR